MKRGVALGLAVASISFGGGILFGWVALRSMLEREGQYSCKYCEVM